MVRVDFNVPINDSGFVTDDTRIRMAIPTIKKIIKDKGSVVLMSHLGRPKINLILNFFKANSSINLELILDQKVIFCDDCISERALSITSELKSRLLLLLENLRFYKEEKLGDKDFARKLSKHADVFINDAFGTAHRAHASTSVIADFFPNNKMFGFLIENEIKSVDKVLNSQNHSLTAIVGGAKVSSKITIILNLLEKSESFNYWRGMAYTFVKAQNGSIGKSLTEDDFLKLALEILDEAKKQNVQLHLP